MKTYEVRMQYAAEQIEHVVAASEEDAKIVAKERLWHINGAKIYSSVVELVEERDFYPGFSRNYSPIKGDSETKYQVTANFKGRGTATVYAIDNHTAFLLGCSALGERNPGLNEICEYKIEELEVKK